MNVHFIGVNKTQWIASGIFWNLFFLQQKNANFGVCDLTSLMGLPSQMMLWPALEASKCRLHIGCLERELNFQTSIFLFVDDLLRF